MTRVYKYFTIKDKIDRKLKGRAKMEQILDFVSTIEVSHIPVSQFCTEILK